MADQGPRLLEIGDGSIASSYCAYLFGRLGADVLKIEPPSGDRLRRRGPFANDALDEVGGLFAALNRGKRLMTLDITRREGKRILAELLARRDLVVHDLPSAVAAEAGLDPGSVQARLPDLIVASVTGYGAEGPYSWYRSYPINASALGGLSVGIGRPKQRPLTVPLELGQYQAGVVTAIGLVAALNALPHVGGQSVDVSEADVWAAVHTGQNVLTYLYLGVSGIRAGNHGIGQYPNSFLRCKDGFMCVNCTPLPHWIDFIKVMGEPEWTKLPRYRNRRAMTEEYPDEVDRLVEEWLVRYTRAEIFKMSRDAMLPVAPALNVAEVLDNEHLRARGTFETMPLGGREYKTPRLPFLMEPPADPPAPTRHPTLGRDTGAILAEVGVDQARVEELYELDVL